MDLKSNSNDVFTEIINFENLPKLLPRQLKKVEVVKKDGNNVFTKEILVFKTLVKNEIIQESRHEITHDHIRTVIISGPAKDSVINMKLMNKEAGCKILISIDLKLSLKARILLPIVKKVYSGLLTGILYKIETLIEKRRALND